eukprot:5061886-Pleurochrysis_carterae.AAC.1
MRDSVNHSNRECHSDAAAELAARAGAMGLVGLLAPTLADQWRNAGTGAVESSGAASGDAAGGEPSTLHGGLGRTRSAL